MPAPFRTRLSVLWLESRDNPSGPTPIDPVGDPTPPPTSEPQPVQTQPAPTQPGDTNPVYNTPIVP